MQRTDPPLRGTGPKLLLSRFSSRVSNLTRWRRPPVKAAAPSGPHEPQAVSDMLQISHLSSVQVVLNSTTNKKYCSHCWKTLLAQLSLILSLRGQEVQYPTGSASRQNLRAQTHLCVFADQSSFCLGPFAKHLEGQSRRARSILHSTHPCIAQLLCKHLANTGPNATDFS